MIDKLDGLNPCIKLQTLFVTNNKIKSWDELTKLSSLPAIKNVGVVNNPALYDDMVPLDDFGPKVIKRVPALEAVDSKMISASIRKAAEEMD